MDYFEIQLFSFTTAAYIDRIYHSAVFCAVLFGGIIDEYSSNPIEPQTWWHMCFRKISAHIANLLLLFAFREELKMTCMYILRTKLNQKESYTFRQQEIKIEIKRNNIYIKIS